MKALANARASEISDNDVAISRVVYAALGLPPVYEEPLPHVFQAWCELKGVRALPAQPATVALFLMEMMIDPEAVTAFLVSISLAHVSRGLADPTTSWPVPAAANRVLKIEAPKSWPNTEKEKFLRLPHDLQRYFAAHEDRSQREIKRALHEAGELRNKLKLIEQKDAESQTAA